MLSLTDVNVQIIPKESWPSSIIYIIIKHSKYTNPITCFTKFPGYYFFYFSQFYRTFLVAQNFNHFFFRFLQALLWRLWLRGWILVKNLIVCSIFKMTSPTSQYSKSSEEVLHSNYLNWLIYSKIKDSRNKSLKVKPRLFSISNQMSTNFSPSHSADFADNESSFMCQHSQPVEFWRVSSKRRSSKQK